MPGAQDRTLVRASFDYAPNLLPRVLELTGFPARNRAALTDTLARLEAVLTR